MPPAAQKVHATTEKIAVLLVSAHRNDLDNLRGILPEKQWEITQCPTAHDAERAVSNRPHSVVICERDLDDGNWRDVVRRVGQSPDSPAVLVVSKDADEGLWADVLDDGGYDVLRKPFDRSELTRAVELAWRHWLSSRSA